jgi:predicted nuclease with TOPRIM domain
VTKTLFRLPGRLRTSTVPTGRMVVAEAPVDAMSLAALEHLRADTLYVATAGGMGPGTIAALERELWALSTQEGGELVIATDADGAGDRYAERLEEMARAIDLRSTRLRPSGGANDWNDVLKKERGP